MPELADVVKTKIQEAFAGTPPPGPELVTDQRGNDPESRDIANAFRGKDWRNVSVAMLRTHGEALPVFTPAAFRYYLPAYLIGSVDARPAIDVAFDSVLFNLTPPKRQRGWAWDFFWARAQQFSPREREAIRSFLELMEERDADDWVREGRQRPESRVKPALDFWKALTETP